MKIDIFNHIFPQNFFDEYIAGPKALPDIGKRVRNMPTIVNLDARFKVMDEFGDYCQVISLPAPAIEAFGGPDTDSRHRALRQRRHGGAYAEASQAFSDLHCFAGDEQSRRSDEGSDSRRDRSGRGRRPNFHQRDRRAAR